MKAVIKRELKNYLKNPVLWLGLIVVILMLYQMLNPYLKIHYFQSEREMEGLHPKNIDDADISEGYVESTEEEQMELACRLVKKEMVKMLGMKEQEAEQILNAMLQKKMSAEEIEAELIDKYEFYGKYGIKYYFQISEYRKASVEEANQYIDENMKEHSFSFYFSRKFADFCGLLMGFFSAVLLAFLFIRDTRKDMYELLHTKPVSAAGYVCGKIGGGFLAMMVVAGVVGGSSLNEICLTFIESTKSVVSSILVIGFTRGILIVMKEALISDTIVYYLSSLLDIGNPVISAIGMLFLQSIINIFINGSSSQATITMPIMAPVADIVGVSRQTAVLAYCFGDGFSDMFWPTNCSLECGLMGIPLERWYKFITPLFLIMTILQVFFIALSVYVY